MKSILVRIMNDQSQEVRGKIIAMYVLLGVFNLVLWTLTFLVSLQYAVVLGTGLLAFTFGLRHGVDDHAVNPYQTEQQGHHCSDRKHHQYERGRRASDRS